MDTFLWWSGVVAWAVLGAMGGLCFVDWALDIILNSLKLKREFLAWVWERLKQKRGHIPGG